MSADVIKTWPSNWTAGPSKWRRSEGDLQKELIQSDYFAKCEKKFLGMKYMCVFSDFLSTLPSLSKKGRGLEKNPGPGDPLKTTGETVELAAKKSFC